MGKALRIIGIVLSLGCLAAIVVLSLASDVSIPKYVVGADKGAHFLAYCALSFSLFLAFFRYEGDRLAKRNVLPWASAFLLSFMVGYLIELIQPAFERSFEVLDLVADGAGALTGTLFGIVCVVLVLKIANRKNAK